MTVATIILAAGHGTRMGNNAPKVLQDLAGQPLVLHVLTVARALAPDAVHLVCGCGAVQVRKTVQADDVIIHEQAEQLGTAHAVACADAALDADEVLVLYGDVPLLQSGTLCSLLADLAQADLVMATACVDDPYGYGRIIRDDRGQVVGIVEQSDASSDELAIKEISTGIIAARGPVLRDLIGRVGNDNAQQEYYLTDCIGLAVAAGLRVKASVLEDVEEAMGVNTLAQLESAERCLQRRRAKDLTAQGCRLRDASRVDIRGRVEVGQNVEIDVNVVFEGEVSLGDNVRIGANCVIANAALGSNTVVRPFSIIESSLIGARCIIGPYARIRPEVALDDEVHIGNFVEIKKSSVSSRTKINHLSYVGDSTVGREVNVGAGTITCNYDGVNKHRTVIGDRVFVGSGTQLVAPVTIGEGTTIGAGSTITQDTKPGKLTLSRSKQKTIDGWKRPSDSEAE